MTKAPRGDIHLDHIVLRIEKSEDGGMVLKGRVEERLTKSEVDRHIYGAAKYLMKEGRLKPEAKLAGERRMDHRRFVERKPLVEGAYPDDRSPGEPLLVIRQPENIKSVLRLIGRDHDNLVEGIVWSGGDYRGAALDTLLKHGQAAEQAEPAPQSHVSRYLQAQQQTLLDIVDHDALGLEAIANSGYEPRARGSKKTRHR